MRTFISRSFFKVCFNVNRENKNESFSQTGLPIAALQALLDPKNDMVLVPADKDFSEYNHSFNKRTQIAPRVRVVAGSAKAVSTTMLWAANNGLRFAVRSGGHSYEGFSQSPDLVIDVRGMTGIKLAADKKSVSIGSGSSLGSVYQALWPSNLAIPAGSCFPVGVAGHSLGGGFGLLGRSFGLACDSVLSMEVVDASGQIRNVSEQENPDLFWALRGGGNGNFAVVTNFNFRTSPVGMVAKIRDYVEQADRASRKNSAGVAAMACGFATFDHGHAAPDKGSGRPDQGSYGWAVRAIRKQFESRVAATSKSNRTGRSSQHDDADVQGRSHDLQRGAR